MDDILCTPEEVEHLLLDLDVSKANGPDLVSARMLKNTATSIAPSIANLFNLSLCHGIVPECWKYSMISPILKSASKPKSDPNNYRPISLTSILCKLLEKHIFDVMYEHLSSNNLLSDSQWGFRPERSAVTALLSVLHEWLLTLEDGNEVCAIFLDYKKAFDVYPIVHF